MDPNIIAIGVQASAESMVTVKRNASAIVYPISANNIGDLIIAKLADPLQRFTDVYITHRRGEDSQSSILRPTRAA